MIDFHDFGSLFSFPEKKQMFSDLDGNIWFNADLVCKELGFKNTARTIPFHTDEDERCKVDVSALNEAWFISESAIWGLILASKSDRAKDFKRLLRKEILPNIRKHGYYLDPKATRSQLVELQSAITHHKNWTVDEYEEVLNYNRSEINALHS